MAYDIQSLPRQSYSSVYSLYLVLRPNRIEEGQMSWCGRSY